MSKFANAQFITTVITMAAIALNNKFAWHLNAIELGASIAVSVNFIFAQIMVDIQKIKAGQQVKFSKTKFATLLISCGIIGFTQYIGFELSTEDVLWIAGIAMAFISGKGFKDVIETKKNASDEERLTDGERIYL
ncbi:hypothetical protein [Paenibacillus sp. RUD330]|uniref:hypothetical protein n=1 Tax=Paenibacillus sp. RUD330 TaxID=2023772 RepID=UPI000B929F75|nr:hypothetical protein [Paenibacillus sp. RUD330]ASS66202.1 hypothetical protein CIC07_08620 [Paenibacillus sp. RUD330]